jgi:hypothetical protein
MRIDPRCRIRRIRFHPHAPLWVQRWFYAELIAKGAVVSVGVDDWEIRW